MTKSLPRVRLQPHHHRINIEWEPKWEPEIRNWASKLIKKNKWRYDPILEHTDLLQDAYIQFLIVKDAYPRVVEPQHFMSLYKTTLLRHLCDEANHNIRRKEIYIQTDFDVNVFADGLIKELDNDGYLSILLQEAPADVRSVLELFNDDATIEKLREPYHRPYNGLSPRETLNERLCSLICTDYLTNSGRKRIRAKYDIVRRIKNWLSDEPVGRKEVMSYVRD